MGLKTWERNAALGKAADAIEGLASGQGGGSFLGWSMDKWKKFGEMLLWAIGGAVATGVGNAFQAGQIHNATDLKGAAIGAAAAAAVAFLRNPQTPPDPLKDPAAK